MVALLLLVVVRSLLLSFKQEGCVRFHSVQGKRFSCQHFWRIVVNCNKTIAIVGGEEIDPLLTGRLE